MSKEQVEQELEKISEWIYEATRVEAEWSKRPIVPEVWEKRDDKFRNQFVDIITKYMAMNKLPTPAEAHESWNQAYYKMGWKYGKVRDVEAKTHPDLVPFDELSQPERDKDAIFLAFVWLAKQTQKLNQEAFTNGAYEEYLICKQRGHQSDGRHEGHEYASWTYCKWCGTKYWTTTVTTEHEENTPKPPKSNPTGGLL